MVARTALITGGAKGIGYAVAQRLCRAGYFVYLNCRCKNQAVEELLAQLTDHDLKAKILEFDVRDAAQIRKAKTEFQHASLHLLVNNAGILKDNLVCDIAIDDWNNVIQTNFWGALNVFNEFRDRLAASENPAVVSLGSIAGVRPRKGQGAYSVSKAMLIEWTRQQALDGENAGISFYAISPGPVETDMIKNAPWYKNPASLKRIPMGRFAKPEEIAELVFFLDQNPGVVKSGANVIVDGGFTQTVKEE